MRGMACVIAASALMLGGCATHHAMAPAASGLSRAEFLGPTKAAMLEKSLTDGDIATTLDADVRAKLPTSIAVAKLNFDYACASLQTIDAEELKGWEKVAAEQSLITGIQPLSGLAMKPAQTETRYSTGVTLYGLRTAAAKQKCELLLVYVQADTQVENWNHAAVLYWTGVGLLIVPGTELEHKTVMQAILVDTRTGTILGTATGDSHLKRTTPAAYAGIEQENLAKRAPEESLKDLQTAGRKLLSQVVASAHAAR